ncbi:lipoxygenase homology domain-containing protein 1-like [Branchiostoma lanceolatum]|uniref:lipoxygenase homology domain-containing protein 1-like n=1 Tax=Branchiostoma lanceolatum TaxID=7740 RepID=UPI0034538E39
MGAQCTGGEANVEGRKDSALVKAKTGNYRGGGTDGNIFIALIDSEGRKSRDIHLNLPWDGFERGTDLELTADDITVRPPLRDLEVWRDDSYPHDNWFCQSFSVKLHSDRNGRTYDFPVDRWIKAGRWIKFR